MPTYEYRCKKCGDFEIVQKISEDALTECPTCSGKVQRLLSAAPFHLKGSGWYKTDYAGSSSSSSSASNDEESSSTDSSKTETKESKTTETKSSESSSKSSSDSD